jgi:hypothetical protein
MFAVQSFQFPFQGFEKGFGARIVPTVPLPAHALANRGTIGAQSITKTF